MFGRSLDQALDGLSQWFKADGDERLFRAEPTPVPVHVPHRERDTIGDDRTGGRSNAPLYAAMTIIGIFASGWRVA